MKLNLYEIKARAEAAASLASSVVQDGGLWDDAIATGEMVRVFGDDVDSGIALSVLAADVLALLDYLDSYEKALKPLRGKTFTYVPGLEILNTVTGPSVADLQVRVTELEAEVENLQRAYNAEMRESVRRR